ncbi:MAG: hypothetical protein V7733_08660 [Paraglaciecola polaris]|tara:strand:+ start:2321 stop:3406 length:1086 start_codon:yes stop_codon:yes gene_type:complete
MSTAVKTAPLSQVLITGVLGSLFVFAITAAIIAPFGHHTFTDWVGTAFMAATPAQVILGLLWHNQKPAFVATLSQPLKGMVLTLITIASGAIVFAFLLWGVGQNQGITPMLVQYAIMTIIAILFLVPIWQCWPFKLLSKDPIKVGIYTLVGAYVIAYILWIVFFDYSMLQKVGHPKYFASLDPSGLFDMWDAMTFSVTAVGLVIVHMLFDFWPIDKLTRGASQPIRGIIATVYLLILSWVLRWVFVSGFGMQQVEYMIRVPVCLILGTFLVNNMMQFSLLTKIAQPIRGILLTICAAIMAIIMYKVYAYGSYLHTGHELGMGPQNGFAKEIWIASAMLGVTFPVIFVVSGFFNFWPLKRPA